MKKLSTYFRYAIAVWMVIFVSVRVDAQTYDRLHLKSIPYPLTVQNDPLDVQIKGDSILKITSVGGTNLFNSPGGNYSVQNAPMVLFKPDNDFTLKTRIKASLKEVYDVASLVVYQNDSLWAKLCFENSVRKETTVVSVVTRGFSDDCNSVNLQEDYVYFLVSKKGKEFSFHYSKDDVKWELVRHFQLLCNNEEVKLGFAVHCSQGEQFSAEFSDIYYSNISLKKMRMYCPDEAVE